MRSAVSVRGIVAVLALVAGPARAGAPAEVPVDHCIPAAIADVMLAVPVPIDEIQVVVTDDSPETGAAEVMVQVGSSDRVVRIFGGSHGIKFFPALTSSAFRVSLLPVFEADRDACVERIELRRGGSPVATVRP
jgi:hypothetical protein